MPGKLLIALIASALWASTASTHAHGDLHERIAQVTDQLLTNAANPELWLLRADLHRQHAGFPEALTDLEHAEQMRPNWAAAALERARISADLGGFKDCERAASACLKLEPGNADARVLRARALVGLKEFKRAIADYDAVLDATNSANPLPDLYLERARAQATLEDWDSALRGLDAGMKRVGVTPSFALPAIEYERKRGTFEAALARLEQAKGFFNAEEYERKRAEIRKQSGQP